MSDHADIVRDALRSLGNHGYAVTTDMALDALDEIVAELNEYKNGPAYQTVVDALRKAEAERDAEHASCVNLVGLADTRAEAAESERDRLREALGRIAHGVHDDATYDILDCALIARAALAPADRDTAS